MSLDLEKPTGEVPVEIKHLDPDHEEKVEEKSDQQRRCTLNLPHPHNSEDMSKCGRPAAYKVMLNLKPCRGNPPVVKGAGTDCAGKWTYMCDSCYEFNGPSGRNQLTCSWHKVHFVFSQACTHMERIIR